MHLFIFLLFYVFYDNMIYGIQHAPYSYARLLCIVRVCMENEVWMSVRISNQYETFILFIFFLLQSFLLCFPPFSIFYAWIWMVWWLQEFCFFSFSYSHLIFSLSSVFLLLNSVKFTLLYFDSTMTLDLIRFHSFSWLPIID